jgi:hypothetical protein
MNRCRDCAHWSLGTYKVFRSARFDVPLSAAPDEGLCGLGFMYGKLVPAAFGCPEFESAADDSDHWEYLDYSDKEPWEVWDIIPCPECQGVGRSGPEPQGAAATAACRRCAGTGKVRQYGDGIIGDEQTRLHPVEIEAFRKAKEDEILARARAEIARIGVAPEPTPEKPLPFA